MSGMSALRKVPGEPDPAENEAMRLFDPARVGHAGPVSCGPS